MLRAALFASRYDALYAMLPAAEMIAACRHA